MFEGQGSSTDLLGLFVSSGQTRTLDGLTTSGVAEVGLVKSQQTELSLFLCIYSRRFDRDHEGAVPQLP